MPPLIERLQAAEGGSRVLTSLLSVALIASCAGKSSDLHNAEKVGQYCMVSQIETEKRNYYDVMESCLRICDQLALNWKDSTGEERACKMAAAHVFVGEYRELTWP